MIISYHDHIMIMSWLQDVKKRWVFQWDKLSSCQVACGVEKTKETRHVGLPLVVSYIRSTGPVESKLFVWDGAKRVALSRLERILKSYLSIYPSIHLSYPVLSHPIPSYPSKNFYSHHFLVEFRLIMSVLLHVWSTLANTLLATPSWLVECAVFFFLN